MTTTESFKIGDVVQLNSGSPALTVDDLRGDGCVSVAWFNGGEVVRDAFLPEELTRAMALADWLSDPEFQAKMQARSTPFGTAATVVYDENGRYAGLNYGDAS